MINNFILKMVSKLKLFVLQKLSCFMHIYLYACRAYFSNLFKPKNFGKHLPTDYYILLENIACWSGNMSRYYWIHHEHKRQYKYIIIYNTQTTLPYQCECNNSDHDGTEDEMYVPPEKNQIKNPVIAATFAKTLCLKLSHVLIQIIDNEIITCKKEASMH